MQLIIASDLFFALVGADNTVFSPRHLLDVPQTDRVVFVGLRHTLDLLELAPLAHT